MAAKFLDDDARAAFKRAIEAVENASSVEIVVAVRRRSAPYHHANAIVGVLVAFVGLAAMLYSSYEFSLSSILFDPFVVGGIAAAVVELLPTIKRRLTPLARLRDQVARAARATFVERGVHNTIGRSGLLVYISWLERVVALVPDSGLSRQLADGVLARAEVELTRAVPRGGAEVARQLEQLANAMSTAMPHRTDDVNELPDAIDEEA